MVLVEARDEVKWMTLGARISSEKWREGGVERQVAPAADWIS